MNKIEAKKQIEIALLAGRVAYAALSLQGIAYEDLSRSVFAELINFVKDLEAAIPKKVSQ
ncbi:MAG: hypothetical protein JXL81_11960 [Deltaproteobacteria bacterium]|nr:hypothetical protein [Deltaproteobacteria bacterium]